MASSIDNLKKRIDILEKELVSIKNQVMRIESGEADGPAEYAADTEAAVSAPVKKQSILDKIRDRTGQPVEASVGGIVIGIIGSLAVIFAAGWFIKYAIDRRWLNESARIIMSILAGCAVVTGAWFLAKKKFKIIPLVVFGTAIAVLYLALFGAYYFYDLLGVKETFGYLFILSIAATLLSRIARSQFLYIFSLVGAFLAPILMSQGENSYRFLFAYMMIFNAIFLFMTREFPWKTTAWTLFIMNTAVVAGWMGKSLSQSSFLVPVIFVTILFHVFMARHYLVVRQGKSLHTSDHLLLVLNIGGYATLGHVIVQQFYPAFLPHFYLAVSFSVVLWHYLYMKIISDDKAGETMTTAVLVGMVPVVITGTVIFARGPWEITSNIAFTGMLSMLGSLKYRKLMVYFAIPLWVITVISLLVQYHGGMIDVRPILNSRFFLYLLCAVFLAGTFYFRREKKGYWTFGILALFLVILASLFESHDYFMDDLSVRRLSYSYVIFAYGLLFIVPGFIKSRSELRITGLALIGIVIAKFYLYDIWVMKLVVRIIAGFTLGISLILMAVFYQKFKEKIVKTVFSRNVVFIVAALLISSSVNAEPLRVKSFKYFKDLNVAGKVEKDHIYGILDIDDDIYRYSYGYDIRVVHGKSGVPYFLMGKTAVIKKKYEKPEVIYDRVTRHGRVYILKLPKIDKGSQYTELPVQAQTGGNYEINIYMSESSKPENWQGVGSYYIYRYGSDKKNNLKFNLTKNRYLRLESSSKISLLFPSAVYIPEMVNEYVHKVPVREIELSSNSDRNATEYFFPNENCKKIHRLIMKFSEGRFSRKYEVLIKKDKKYSHLSSGTIMQNKSTPQIIDLPGAVTDPLKVVVIDGDNEPLKLEGFAVTGPREVCIVELPGNFDSSSLRLYYGNRYIKEPEYDIDRTYDPKLKFIKLKAGKNIKNPDFSYSALEPPVSSWIIRVIFILGLLGLSWPSYRIIKKYAVDIREEGGS